MEQNNKIGRCDFRIHDIIDGKYRVERVLNGNLNDQKYKVIDQEGKEYVLKLLKLWEVEPRLQQAMSLRSESEINSCKIKSHYLTQIAKSGKVNGNPYVLTEFLQVSNLTQLMKRQQIDVADIAKQILYGLHDLHRSGKVHCALVPGKVLVTNENRVLLTSYIILGDRSRTVMSMTRDTKNARQVNKGLAYAAPEFFQLQKNATILPTADIYSFGVILFQMLTGELPFGELQTEADWIRYQGRVLSGDWNKSLIQRGTDRSLWIKILEGCLAAKSIDRFESVDEILKLLPETRNHYEKAEGSKVEAPSLIQNGLLLKIVQGDEFGKKFLLKDLFIADKRIVTIGRANEELINTISLKEATTNYVSRHHCTIEWDDEANVWYVRDGQWEKDDAEPWHRSLNGTYVNSNEIDEEGCKIVPRDIISIGDIKLRVEGY